MKTKQPLKLLIALLIAMLFAVNTHAQVPYTKGHVFTISMIKILPGQGDDYITNLKTNLKLVNDEAMKEGLLISYRMFMGAGSSPGDFNFMILDEYADANNAMGNDDKWDAIRQKLVGDNTAAQALMATRTKQREILGTKDMQEIFFK